ncbi:uncharacterized protein LOC122853196 [Aphidius gifuensis]|uniref:uncharacterized protein LOC122853196 n=1 Tax=Aphidius gifuensis TaxID=684658 RepID=UPI001CDC508D|nr:uncharacterized protein LOC122853196 [Aphidius gifuensis]
MDNDSNINPGPKHYRGAKNNKANNSTENLIDNTIKFEPVDIKVEDINESDDPLDVNFVSLNNQNTSGFADLYVCHICGVHCETELSQKIHIQVHVDANEIFPCTICNELFDEKSILDTHMITTHDIIKVTSSNEESDGDDDDDEDYYYNGEGDDDYNGEGADDDDIDNTKTSTSSLSERSKERYAIIYNALIEWKNKKNIKELDEKLLLNYFHELSKKIKPPTLKSHYFMLKKTIQLNDGIDIGCYKLLNCYLRKKSDGYFSTRSKIFTSKEIEHFLNDAPDKFYLAVKVAFIFGFIGACRCKELYNMTIDDLKDDGSLLIVTIRPEANRKQRIFTVEGEFYNIYKKYILLRPNDIQTNRLFIKLKNGKCINIVIGKNNFGRMPKEIAKYLNLPNLDLYTGSSFRRTSAKLLADSGVDINTLKLHGGWKTEHVIDFIKEAAENKKIQALKNTNNNNTKDIPREPKPTMNFIPQIQNQKMNPKLTKTTSEIVILNKQSPNNIIKQEDIEPLRKKVRKDNDLPSTSKPLLLSTPPPLTPITPMTPTTSTSSSSTSSSSAPLKNCVALINGNNFTITPTSQHIFNFHNCQINITFKK